MRTMPVPEDGVEILDCQEKEDGEDVIECTAACRAGYHRSGNQPLPLTCTMDSGEWKSLDLNCDKGCPRPSTDIVPAAAGMEVSPMSSNGEICLANCASEFEVHPDSSVLALQCVGLGRWMLSVSRLDCPSHPFIHSFVHSIHTFTNRFSGYFLFRFSQRFFLFHCPVFYLLRKRFVHRWPVRWMI